MDMHRLWMAATLAALSGAAFASNHDVDAALVRLGPLEQAGDFAGIDKLLRPYADSGNGQVEYYLAFAGLNLAIDGKKPSDIQAVDIQSAIRFAEHAAQHGTAQAWNLLYIIYGNGYGIPAQSDKALGYLKRGVEAGDEGATLWKRCQGQFS
jgi:TPR repeat protein